MGVLMAIRFDERTRLFTLETETSEYQIKADKYEILHHLWYGEKTHCDMEYLQDYPDVGFSGNIYEAENDRTYSADTMLLEYSCKGNGDYRISAADVTHSDGSTALDLQFEGYKIYKGKYSVNGLPAVYADESDVDTLEIYLEDTAADVKVTLKFVPVNPSSQ